MDKEIIEKFDKEQLDILLNDLQDIDKFTGFKDGTFKYELGKYQANLLINCIKKQKEIIDKVAEYIEKHIKYECDDAYKGMQFYRYHLYDFNKQDLLDILKEVK